MSPVPTCDIYLRLSDARIEEALEGREAKLRRLADSLGWFVHRVVIENDMVPGKDGRMRPATAFKRRKIITPSGRKELRVIRPGFRQVLDNLEAGRTNGLLAEDLDRVFRDPRDLEDFIDIAQERKANARSLSGSLTFTNGGTDSEIDMARMLVTMANKASRDTSRRVKDKKEVLHGQSWFGGSRPYGYVQVQDTEKYHRNLEIEPYEADVLRAAASDILERDIPLKAIARDLRQRGVPTTRGGKWTSQTLRHALLKPTIAGLVEHKGIRKTAPWPEILDPDVWQKLKDKLEDPARRNGTGNEPKWLLSGIATCGICNDGSSVHVTGSEVRSAGPGYVCDSKAHLRRNARHADAWVERNITAYISVHYTELLKPEPKEDINANELRAEAKKLHARRVTQLRMHAEGLIDDSELAQTLRNIKDRIDVIDAQLATSDKPDPLPEFRRHGPTREIWRALPLARKRAIVSMLVDITMYPTTRRGPGLDPDSVRIIVKPTGEALDVRLWP